MNEQPDWIAEERARLAAELQDQRTDPANYALDGAEALWIASSKGAPEIAALGAALLEQACTPEKRSGLTPVEYLDAGLAHAFTGIHAAWSTGESYTAEDAQQTYRMLEPALSFAHSNAKRGYITAVDLRRTLFLGTVARAYSADVLMLPAPPSVKEGYDGNEIPHDSFTISNGNLTPTHIVSKVKGTTPLLTKILASDMLQQGIARYDRPYFLEMIRPLSQSGQQKAAFDYLTNLMLKEYGGALPEDEGVRLGAVAHYVMARLSFAVSAARHSSQAAVSQPSR